MSQRWIRTCEAELNRASTSAKPKPSRAHRALGPVCRHRVSTHKQAVRQTMIWGLAVRSRVNQKVRRLALSMGFAFR